MKLIVGLGNPGRKYAKTRHNIGFMVLDEISLKYEITINKKKFSGIHGKGQINKQEVILLKPLTYMNLSGQTVAPMMDWYKIDPLDLILIYDDIDLPFGQIRIRDKGSAGGHKGMDSIIKSIGTNQFIRLRLGIGRPDNELDAADYVLAKFTKDEEKKSKEIIDSAVKAINLIIKDNITEAMNKFNIRINSDIGEEKS